MNSRNIFFKTLEELMEKDKDIMFLTDDLGYSYMEKIQEKFPEQFINCGCIEQSMIGIAVGMAMAGKKPYVYGTTPFILFRPLEQVRNDIAQMGFNIKLIGVAHSGFLGFTHNLLHEKEDVVICKNIKLKSYIPKTLKRVHDIILETYKSNKPVYIRL